MTADAPAAYTLGSVNRLLGLSRHAITQLIQLGFVQPSRGPGQRYRFSFQDIVLLRSAHALRLARIPTRQILRSLRLLKESLPAEIPGNGIRIASAGGRITVRANDLQWEPDTGQVVMDFSVTPDGGVQLLFTDAGAPGGASEDLFALAESLEGTDPAAAEAAYRQLLERDAAHAHAYLNLGFMLCEAGRCQEAVTLYDEALRHCIEDALVHYNRAVALEDLGRVEDALASYEASLALQPDLADAHQNAALLYARTGHKQLAIRHFSAFRRLQPRQ